VAVLVDGQNVHPSRILTDQVSESFKKMIINTARNWPVYFSRLFSVSVRYFLPSFCHGTLCKDQHNMAEFYLQKMSNILYDERRHVNGSNALHSFESVL